MNKQKIGISVINPYPIAIEEVITLIAETGFDAISPSWGNTVPLLPVVKAAEKCGLQLQSLHAPFSRIAALWENSLAAERALNELDSALQDCITYHIPVMVVHAWIGFTYEIKPNSYGIDNFEKLVNKAGKHGVKIAFENTEGTEFLAALMHHFADTDAVGFCWDSGHEQCYHPKKKLLTEYGNRLIMTHLNDNMGLSDPEGKITSADDLHLLPYDGVSDWDTNIKMLKSAKPQEILNFELKIQSKPGRHENDSYRQMPLQQYFALAYERACKISSQYY